MFALPRNVLVGLSTSSHYRYIAIRQVSPMRELVTARARRVLPLFFTLLVWNPLRFLIPDQGSFGSLHSRCVPAPLVLVHHLTTFPILTLTRLLNTLCLLKQLLEAPVGPNFPIVGDDLYPLR